MTKHVKPEHLQAILDLTSPELVEGYFWELWEKWTDALIYSLRCGHWGNIPGEITAKHTGCTPTAPYALMFTGFCLGVEAGIAEAEADTGPAEGTGGKCKQ